MACILPEPSAGGATTFRESDGWNGCIERRRIVPPARLVCDLWMCRAWGQAGVSTRRASRLPPGRLDKPAASHTSTGPTTTSCSSFGNRRQSDPSRRTRTFIHSATGIAPRVIFSIATASSRLGRLAPRHRRSRCCRATPSSRATSSRVRPAASIHRESFVSRLRGRPRGRFAAAGIAQHFYLAAARVKLGLPVTKPVARETRRVYNTAMEVGSIGVAGAAYAQLPQVLTVEEVADLMRVDRKTAYAAIAEGGVPGVRRIGRCIRVSRDVLLRWLAEGEGRAALRGRR